MALKLNIIIASTRPGRAGPTIAKWVAEQSRLNEAFDVTLLDLADFKLPLLDEPAHPRLQQYQHEHTKHWAQAIAPADAFLFVVPEYDFFVNAALVNALQFLSVEWAYKVAGVVSYGGVSGGLRSTQELRQLLGNLNVMALPQSVPLPFFSKFISEDQVFMPTEQMTDGLKLVLGELAKWGTALQHLRKG